MWKRAISICAKGSKHCAAAQTTAGEEGSWAGGLTGAVHASPPTYQLHESSHLPGCAGAAAHARLWVDGVFGRGEVREESSQNWRDSSTPRSCPGAERWLVMGTAEGSPVLGEVDEANVGKSLCQYL